MEFRYSAQFMFTRLLLSPRHGFLWPFAKAALLAVCGEVDYRGHLSYSLIALKGVIQGSIIGVNFGDTRSLD